MPRIFTPPDIDFDRTIPKIFIRNCPWTEAQMSEYVQHLGDKIYDLYIYNDSMNDIQWAEGIRTQSVKVYDWNHYRSLDPIEWLRTIEDVIR